MRRLCNLYLKQWEKGLFQRDVAKAAGLGKTNYTLICTGRVLPSREEMLRIAKALDSRPEDLFPETYFQITGGTVHAENH